MAEIDKEVQEKKIEASEKEKSREEKAEPKSAGDYLNEAWNSLTVVNKEKDERVPKKKKELRRFKKYLHKAEDLYPENPESIAFMHELQNFYGYWKKRKLRADFRLISFCIILLGYLFFRYYRIASGYTDITVGFEAFWASFPRWLSLYIVAWLVSLILYFPAYRVPMWMSDTGKFHGKTTIIEFLNLFTRNPVKGAVDYGNKHGRRVGDKYDVPGRENMFLKVIGYAIFMVLTVALLPLVTIIGFLRFYVFYQ